MAVGGALQSGYPSQGLTADQVETIGSADHDEIAVLPNEQARVVTVDEDGQHFPPSALPATLNLESQATASQDKLTDSHRSVKVTSAKKKGENQGVLGDRSGSSIPSIAIGTGESTRLQQCRSGHKASSFAQVHKGSLGFWCT